MKMKSVPVTIRKEARWVITGPELLLPDGTQQSGWRMWGAYRNYEERCRLFPFVRAWKYGTPITSVRKYTTKRMDEIHLQCQPDIEQADALSGIVIHPLLAGRSGWSGILHGKLFNGFRRSVRTGRRME